MSTVKTGDRYPITLTVNMDLTGCTVRLLARNGTTLHELPNTVTDLAGGVIEHTLDGSLDLPDGRAAMTWMVEAEATRGSEIVTFPNEEYAHLTVMRDLDH